MGATVVANVHAGVMILLPFLRSRLAIASRHADEPELTNTPNFLPNLLEISCSNLADLGPCPPSQPDFNASVTASISSSP